MIKNKLRSVKIIYALFLLQNIYNRNESMLTISRLLGIIIRMYSGSREHNPPHSMRFIMKKKLCLEKNKLILKFNNNERKIVDFEEEIVSSTGELITQLKDVNVFKKFHIDRTFGTVEWENGFDYDPDILYEIGINL